MGNWFIIRHPHQDLTYSKKGLTIADLREDGKVSDDKQTLITLITNKRQITE